MPGYFSNTYIGRGQLAFSAQCIQIGLKNKGGSFRSTLIFSMKIENLFLCALSVAAHKLVHTTGSVHQLGFTGIERVRRA